LQRIALLPRSPRSDSRSLETLAPGRMDASTLSSNHGVGCLLSGSASCSAQLEAEIDAAQHIIRDYCIRGLFVDGNIILHC
jgi:hypothetical protein